MKDVYQIKDFFDKLQEEHGISRLEILKRYNNTYNTNITKESFYRSINSNKIKYNFLVDILKCIGYKIDITIK